MFKRDRSCRFFKYSVLILLEIIVLLEQYFFLILKITFYFVRVLSFALELSQKYISKTQFQRYIFVHLNIFTFPPLCVENYNQT